MDLNVVELNASTPTELIIDLFTLASQYALDVLRLKLEYMLALHIADENVCSLLLFAESHSATKVLDSLRISL